MSVENAARRVAVACAIAWMAALALVFALRIGFPLELEWMEGGALHQALRLQRGQPIYPPPGPDFVPFLYTPLYAEVLALLGRVFPLGLALARIVSVLAWIAVCVAVHRAVVGAGKPRAHAWIAVGLVCSAYVFTFRWIDLARADSLFIALVIWAVVLLAEAEGDRRKAALAGGLMALAFWTKQTAAVLVLASGAASLLVARRQAISIYTAVIAVIAGGGVLVGQSVTDGWLWTYVYELHQTHAFNRERFTTKTWGMFVHAAPFLVLVVVGLVAGAARRGRPRLDARARLGLYWLVLGCAGLLVSALGYATQWAEPNAFIPGVVLGAVALVIAIPAEGRPEARALMAISAQLVFAMVFEPRYQPIQSHGLAGLGTSYTLQDLARTIPSPLAYERAAALRGELEHAPGEVLALHRPWWSIVAGGDGHVGAMGLNDVPPGDRAAIEQALRADLRAGRFAWVWLEGDPPPWMRGALQRYRLERRLHGDERVRPMSGWMSDAGMVTTYDRDQLLYVRID